MMMMQQRIETVEASTWSERLLGGVDGEKDVKTTTNSPNEGVQKV